MAFRVPGQGAPGEGRPVVILPRWPRLVLPLIIIVVLALVLISVGAGIWTDFLWYSSVGDGQVFTTTYGTRWMLFGIGAVFMVGIVGLSIWLAYRLRPDEPLAGPRNPGLEAYRQAIDPHRRAAAFILLGVIGLISGIAASGSWQTWLLFFNRTSFGVKDAQFHLDLSFYVMVYPFIRLALSFCFAAVLLSFVLAGAVHLLYGGLRLARNARATTGARIHLFVLAGIFVGLKAAAYWVDRYAINFSQRGVVQTGASYTDVNAVLPAKTILAVIAVICAALFILGAVRQSPLLPAMGFGLLVLSAVLIGGVYPYVIQQFVVRPNEQVKESPYLAREIAATRTAYGVNGAVVSSYSATPTQGGAQLAQAATSLPDTRLLDPGVVSQAYQQLQQVKGYYQFEPPVLAVDRYKVGGAPLPQDMVVSVRDMNGPPAGQANWINTHLIYTHGYGFVAGQANSVTADGNPQFTEADIPPSGSLGNFQPRVYFGYEGTPYVIVGGDQPELDYPNGSSGGQQNTVYTGGGGVPVGSLLNRMLYAINFRDLNIMLSSAITSGSRVIYTRDPISRVAKVAPFLTLDGNAYPVISGGQMLWVVDGYTTTDNYPYSKRIDLGAATTDSYNPNGAAYGPGSEVNYLRNSVKATVNAYTGAVHIYQWGSADPILRTWMKVFPGLVSPRSAIPADLLPHLRYPEVMFDAQRQILAQFHVTQPAAFYGGQNYWSVPNDPTNDSPVSQPPYYLTMTMPGMPSPEFSLSTVFAQRGRSNLAAFMAVDSNPVSPDYGQIRILQLPQNAAILGPQQVQSNFEANTTASSQLSLFRQGGSKVILGNLITLPLAGGLISIEPIYIQASSTGNNGAYPQLKRVFVYYNGNVGFDSSYTLAVADAVGITPPGQGGSGSNGGTGGSQGGGGTGGGGTGGGGTVSAQVQYYLNQAESYYQQAQQALKNGDLAGYAADIAKMKTALDQALAASGASGAGASPGASAGASPGASPGPSGAGKSPSAGLAGAAEGVGSVARGHLRAASPWRFPSLPASHPKGA